MDEEDVLDEFTWEVPYALDDVTRLPSLHSSATLPPLPVQEAARGGGESSEEESSSSCSDDGTRHLPATSVAARHRIHALQLRSPAYLIATEIKRSDFKCVAWQVDEGDQPEVIECAGEPGWMTEAAHRYCNAPWARILAASVSDFFPDTLALLDVEARLRVAFWLGPGVTRLSSVPVTYEHALRLRMHLLQHLTHSLGRHIDQSLLGDPGAQPACGIRARERARVYLSMTHCGAVVVATAHGACCLAASSRWSSGGTSSAAGVPDLWWTVPVQLVEGDARIPDATVSAVKACIQQATVQVPELLSFQEAASWVQELQLLPQPRNTDFDVPIHGTIVQSPEAQVELFSQTQEEVEAHPWAPEGADCLLTLTSLVGFTPFVLNRVAHLITVHTHRAAALQLTSAAASNPSAEDRLRRWWDGLGTPAAYPLDGEWRVGQHLHLLRRQPLNLKRPCLPDVDTGRTGGTGFLFSVCVDDTVLQAQGQLRSVLQQYNGKVLSARRRASENAAWQERLHAAVHVSALEAEAVREGMEEGACVLKVLLDVDTRSPRLDARLWEAHVLAALPEHPGLQRLLHAYHGDTSALRGFQDCVVPGSTLPERTPFIVSPRYCFDLHTLAREKRRLRRGVHGWHGEELALLLLQLSRALMVLREWGVVHADLKADNVMFDVYGRAVLIDFGLAFLMRQQAGSPRFLPEGQPKAALDPTTLHWLHDAVISPELRAFRDREGFAGAAEAPLDTEQIAARADVYSLGLMLASLVSEDVHAFYQWQQQQGARMNAPRPRLHPKLPVPLRRILEACMQPAPEERLSPQQLYVLTGVYLWVPDTLSTDIQDVTQWKEQVCAQLHQRLLPILRAREQDGNFALPRQYHAVSHKYLRKASTLAACLHLEFASTVPASEVVTALQALGAPRTR